MKHVKKVALMFTTILLIISLTSCAFLDWLWPSPQMQEDWVAESREQTDMIFANYMDFAKKTINEYFPDADVKFDCELHDEKGIDLIYASELNLDDFSFFALKYQCFYERPSSESMIAYAKVCVDKTSTNEEIEATIKTFAEMLNELAKFSIYLFPQDDPFDSLYQPIIDEFDTSSNVNDAGNKYDLHHEVWFPENNNGEPTSEILVLIYECDEHAGKVNISLHTRGYLTNEHALKYQK